MKHTRWGHLLSAILILALSLAACSKKSQENKLSVAPRLNKPAVVDQAPDADEPLARDETINITFACNHWGQDLYKKLARVFQAQNPGIEVHIVPNYKILGLDESEYSSIDDEAMARLAGAADALAVPRFDPSFMWKYAQDLSPFIAQDPNFQPEDFYPNTLEGLQWNGGVWALPSLVDFYLIVYDKGAFDEAGLSYPEPGWTWDDFLDKALALTTREGDQVTRWGVVNKNRSLVVPFIWGRADDLLASTPPTPALDSPQAAQAVRWYVDLFQKHQVMPHFTLGPQKPEPEDPQETILVKEGRAAMWSDHSAIWRLKGPWRSLGIAPFPVDGPQSRSTQLFLQGYIMSAGTTHPNETWRWLNFLTHQELVGYNDTSLPARRSVAERSGFWSGLDKDTAATYRFALEHSFSDVQVAPIQESLFWAIYFIIERGKDVQASLEETQAAVQQTTSAISRELSQTEPLAVLPLPAPTPRADTVITFAPVDYSKKATYRLLADIFHQQHPDVAVDVLTLSGPGRLAARAEEADCFISYPYLSSAEERAAVLSLEPFIDADPGLDLADFMFVDSFRHGGQVWALPAQGFPKVVAYNKALFDAAGVDYPALDWTLDDFLDTAVALTQAEREQYGFVSGVFETTDLMFFLEQQGASLIDTSSVPADFLFDAPATRAAVQWYADLGRVYQAKPIFKADWQARSASQVTIERDALIREGRAAMWSDYPGSGFMFSFEEELEVGFAPLPQGPGQVGDYRIVGYYISAQAQQPQACWEWISFLSQRAEQVEGLPARHALAESEAFQRRVGQEKVAALLRGLTEAQGVPAFLDDSKPGWTDRPLHWLTQAFDTVVDSGLDVDLALAQAQHKADLYRACLTEKNGFEDGAAWDACAREVEGQ